MPSTKKPSSKNPTWETAERVVGRIGLSHFIGSIVGMVALRSRRLESLFGGTLDTVTASDIYGLVVSAVKEDFDLDFKATLYGRTDADRRALAGDVAAMANSAGGVIVLGVAEDDHARAASALGVDLSDAEVGRIRQVVASLVAPMPVFDVLSLADPQLVQPTPNDHQAEAATGFMILAVPRSPQAPHAVLVNEALRYPKRNGATTRYLSEPEVATAYRERQHARACRPSGPRKSSAKRSHDSTPATAHGWWSPSCRPPRRNDHQS